MGSLVDHGAPAALTGITAIAAGGYHSLALKSDGTAVGWGIPQPQTSSPAGLAGVTAIAAGNAFSVALRNDGTVVAWVTNSVGQTNVPPGLSGVTRIAAGLGHTLALKGDGTVVAWGYDAFGQTNVPAGLSGVIAIAAGGYDSLAVVGSAEHDASRADRAPHLAVDAHLAGRAFVPYPVSATDAVDPAPVIECSSPSGSLFPIGYTEVSCVATDNAWELGFG